MAATHFNKLLFALAFAGFLQADTWSYTASADWNLSGSNTSAGASFDLSFPIDQLPAGATVTGATLATFQSTFLDGPGGNMTGCLMPSLVAHEGTTTNWGYQAWCTGGPGGGYFYNTFSVSLEGYGNFYEPSALHRFWGTQNYPGGDYSLAGNLATPQTNAALTAHSGPLDFTLDTNVYSFFLGWGDPFVHPDNFPAPAFTTSAVGRADITMNVMYNLPEVPQLLTPTPEPSFYALVGLALAAMGWRRAISSRAGSRAGAAPADR